MRQSLIQNVELSSTQVTKFSQFHTFTEEKASHLGVNWVAWGAQGKV